MTETIRYGRIGKEDIRLGTGTFEVRLADGRVVTLNEANAVELVNEIISLTNPVATLYSNDIITKGPWIDVRAYADSGSGTSADPYVNALRNAISSNGSARYYLPAGHYKDTSSLSMTNNDLMIMGDGRQNTIIHYDQADETNCWEFKNSGSIVSRIVIHGIGFDGDDTATGFAIYIEDGSKIYIDGIWIEDFNAAATSGGIKVAGREQIVLRNSRILDTETSIYLTGNPNHSTIDVDFFTIKDCGLGGGGSTSSDTEAIKIDAEGIYNFGIENVYVANARYGIHLTNSATFTSGPVFIKNFRTEQHKGTTNDWAIYWDYGDEMISMVLDGCKADATVNGFYIRGGRHNHFINLNSETSSLTSLDVDTPNAGDSIILLGGTLKGTVTTNVNGSTASQIFQTAATPQYGFTVLGGLGYFKVSRGFKLNHKALTYSSSITPDLDESNVFLIRASDANAFTVENPVGASFDEGQEFIVVLENNTGGALGTVSWGSNYIFDGGSAPTKPATGKSIVLKFAVILGSTAKALEVSRSTDISF